MKALVCCRCGGVSTYVKTGYKGLYPKTPVPDTYISKDGYKLLETMPPNSDIYKFLAGVLKRRGRYGYYLSWNEDGSIEEVYNFIKNKRMF